MKIFTVIKLAETLKLEKVLSFVFNLFISGLILSVFFNQVYAIDITSWSNTKTNDQDLIFMVNQGDQITFSISTNIIPGEYIWTVNQLQQAGNNSTFNWTVPNGDSTWNIMVEAREANLPVIGVDLSKLAFKTWTVTTTQIINVPVGGDIQTAINSLSADGGVVELAAGTHNLTAQIQINKNNITLRGQGIDITTIYQLTNQEDGIVVSTFSDWWTRELWLYNNGIKWEVMLQWFEDHPEEVVNNVTIDGLSIYTPGSSVVFAGIGATEVKNLTISNVKVTGNATTNYSFGIFLGHFVGATVINCIIDHVGQGLKYFGGCYLGNVINTTISNTMQFTVIEYNGVNGKDGITAKIIGNHSYANQGCIEVYSSLDVEVLNNLVEDTYWRFGIWVNCPTGYVKVMNNIVHNQNYGGYTLAAGISIEQTYAWPTVTDVIGNLIYNNEAHGIWTYDWHDSLTISANIKSNTIYGNGMDGIHNPQGQPIILKDNIITNSGGYGINTVTNNSYNNIWNNSSGNYINASTGVGDISVDPLFADATNSDFHLKSQYGRWNGSSWVNDAVTSPCIDAGDPLDDYSNEPMLNGGRINIGSYGNTTEASKSAGASGEMEEQLITEFTLHQNFPNPFNPETNISFDLPKNSFVSLKIYNHIGQEVATLVNEQLSAGTHSYKVGREQFGLASGVYFYRLSAGEFVQTRKMLMLK